MLSTWMDAYPSPTLMQGTNDPPEIRCSRSFDAPFSRNVTLHGQAGGIQGGFDAVPCSKERNDPPDKPVVFMAASMLSGGARNETIHRISRGHSKWLRCGPL